MNIYEFLIHFKDEISNLNSHSNYEDYQKYHLDFYKKTLSVQNSVKQSFFETTKKLINDKNFNECLEFGLFINLGLFDKDDISKFKDIICKVTENLNKIDNQNDLEKGLDYVYQILNMLFHEGLFIDTSVLNELKNKIEDSKKLDPKNFREMPLRFIEQFLLWQ